MMSTIKRCLILFQWKIFDGLRWGKKHLIPGWVLEHFGYILLVPAVIIVGFLVIGMVNILWYSLLTYSPEYFIINKVGHSLSRSL